MEDDTDDAIMLSSRVKCLANEIYKELDIIIKKFGDNSIKNLMPLIVSILGSLEEYQVSKEELEINYNVLQEDQKFLLSEFEKEKTSKRNLQEKMNKFEDYLEEVKREKESDKLKSNKSLKRLELSIKNLQDQLTRYEEREIELKKNNQKLHDRYSELLKNHAEYVDKTKFFGQIDSNEKNSQKVSVPIPMNNVLIQPKLIISQPNKIIFNTDEDFDSPGILPKLSTGNTPLKNEIDSSIAQSSTTQNETTKQKVIKSILDTTPELNCDHELSFSPNYQVYRNEEPNFDDLSMSGDIISDGSQDPFESPVEGVTREVQNILRENHELIQDRNAFKIALDDLMTQVNTLENDNTELRDDLNSQLRAKSSLQIRIQDLEQENISLRRQVESLQAEIKNQDEEDVPWAKKMWFSRSEMSKMIIERNHFKMQLAELQNNIEWIEMNKAEQRNNRKSSTRKKISDILFSMLFGQSGANTASQNSSVTYYNANTNSLNSASHTRAELSPSSNRKNSLVNDNGSGCKVDYVNPNMAQNNFSSPLKCSCYNDLFTKIDSNEVLIPGWECPSLKGIIKHREINLSRELRFPETSPKNQLFKQLFDLTSTPIFSRPINESFPDMEIWCGTSTYRDTPIDIEEGVVRIGHSKFFENPKLNLTSTPIRASISSANQSTSSFNNQSDCSHELATSTGLPDERVSEMVWVCSLSMRSNLLKSENDESVDVKSQITIVDMNQPRKVIETFGVVKSQILSIGSAPAFNKSILEHLKSTNSHWQSIPFTLNSPNIKEDINSLPNESVQSINHASEASRRIYNISRVSFSTKLNNSFMTNSTLGTSYSSEPENFSQETIKVNPKNANKETADASQESSKDVSPSATYENLHLPSTSQPTVWLGSQSGELFIHSSVSQFDKALNTVTLPDSITGIQYMKGKMFVSLANSKVYIFRRIIDDKQNMKSEESLLSSMAPHDKTSIDLGKWDLSQAIVLNCGHPQYSIRSIVPIVNLDTIWIAYRNSILIVDTNTFQLLNVIQAHPKHDAQIRQMAWIADGVWISIRRESIIRLYNAFTHQHIQDVDIQSAILKTLKTNLNGSQQYQDTYYDNKIQDNKNNLRLTITSLLPSRDQLWISTNIGITITMPYSIYMNSQDRIEDDLVPSEYSTIDEEVENNNIEVFDSNLPNQVSNHQASNNPTKNQINLRPKMMTAAKVEPGYLQISRYSHMKDVRFLLQIRAHGPPEAHTALSKHKLGLSTSWDIDNSDEVIKQKYSQIMIITGGQGYQRLAKRGCTVHQNKTYNQEDEDNSKKNYLFAWLLPNTTKSPNTNRSQFLVN